MLPNISPAEAQKMLRDSKARLVDVREADELAAVRIAGAEAAPLSVISWMNLAPATAELPIIFTCNSGNRTTKNSDLLQKLAAGPAWQMEGGVSAWAKQGLPVESTQQPLPIFRQIQIGWLPGACWPAGLPCVALHALALGLCWCGADICRCNRLLRPGAAAGSHALEQKIEI